MSTLNGSYREFTLDNGLHVMLQNTPTQTISGRLRVNFGALNEQPGEEGLAHFLEHTLMTGGSTKYSPEETDRVRGTFGSYNAMTGLDKTFFPVDILSEDLGLYLDFVSDITFNPRLDATRFEEERQRVLRETSDAKSNPGFKDGQAYQKAFFGEGSPHTYFTLGNEDVIRSVTPEQMRQFQARGYGASNMDLILVGNLPDDIEELVHRNFRDRPAGDNTKFQFPKNPDLENRTLIHSHAPELYNQDQPQESSAQLSMGIVAPTETTDDSYAVEMLTQILGGDGNSRLFQTVSQRKGLAYGVGSQYACQNNSGSIYVGGSIQSTRADEAIDAIFEEMKGMQEKPVSGKELDRLKRNSRYGIAKAFETNEGHTNAIQSKYDKNITPEEHLAKIDAVTPADVQRAAQVYLPKDREQGKYVLMLRDPLKQ